MKKNILLLIGCILFVGCVSVEARPPHGGRGPRPYGPPGGYHYHYHEGLGLAAGITGVVANGLGIVNNLVAPRTVVVAPASVYPTVYPTPVAPAPAVYPQPVVTTSVYNPPVYTAPPVVPIYRNVPIYDAYGRVIGYRRVVEYVK